MRSRIETDQTWTKPSLTFKFFNQRYVLRGAVCYLPTEELKSISFPRVTMVMGADTVDHLGIVGQHRCVLADGWQSKPTTEFSH